MVDIETKRKAINLHHGGFTNASDADIDRVWAGLTLLRRKEYLYELSGDEKTGNSTKRKRGKQCR